MSGRGTGISLTEISYIIGAFRSRRKAQQRKRLINDNRYLEDEQVLEYSLIEVNFNEVTGNTKIIIGEHSKYRTIERFIIDNYQKYPVYSDWKTKTKKLNKTIKLTNFVLENLFSHEDELIKIFAEEIILNLNNDELIPSWLLKKCLDEEYTFKKSKQTEGINKLTNNFDISLEQYNAQINETNLEISILDQNKDKVIQKISKREKQIIKLKKYRKLFLLSIIYSNNRKNKLTNNKISLEESLANIQKNINILEDKI